MNTETYNQIKSLSEKIAEELVFAEAGKDNGLLPVNSLLLQIEDLLSGHPKLNALASALKPGRGLVDEVFETSGQFSADLLARLRDWVEWWVEAVDLHENNQPIPALPETESEVKETVSPTAVKSTGSKSASTEKQVAVAAHASADEPLLNLNLPEDKELLMEFVNEGIEHLTNIEQGVLVLESNPQDMDTLNSIFRAFHTFKGGSGFLNLTAIQTLAHELESLLDQARQNQIVITPPIINIILEGQDTLKRFTDEIAAQINGEKPHKSILVPTLGLLGRIQLTLGGKVREEWGQSAPAAKPAAVKAAEVKAPVESVIENTAKTEEPSKVAVAAAPAETVLPGINARAATAAVKVDTLKLDTLVDLVGEMVIAQSLVAQSRDLASVQSEQLTRDLAQLGRISKDLQRTAMSMRMVPIRATFQKMNRVVRDIAAKVGKEVELVTIGEDTELDRTIVEELNDPLVHMVRNSIDHGIEKPETRLERGKSSRGTITLRAFHQGGNIVVEIQDDGNGLNRDKIMAKAVEKGLVKEGQVLTDSEVFGLVMSAGFSTAEKVTDISGRGVGMDVVKRNIEKLRGKIDIRSTPGKGSTFSIYLPLTLAIIDGLLVGVGEHRYIVPTLSVCESFRPTADMITTLSGRGEMIRVRGRMRPLLRLYDQFGITPGTTDPTQGIVVVVEAGQDARCVLVDHLLGKQEVVIKSLGESFRSNQFISGAAILGDGRVGLILDPQALVYLENPSMEVAA